MIVLPRLSGADCYTGGAFAYNSASLRAALDANASSIYLYQVGF